MRVPLIGNFQQRSSLISTNLSFALPPTLSFPNFCIKSSSYTPMHFLRRRSFIGRRRVFKTSQNQGWTLKVPSEYLMFPFSSEMGSWGIFLAPFHWRKLWVLLSDIQILIKPSAIRGIRAPSFHFTVINIFTLNSQLVPPSHYFIWKILFVLFCMFVLQKYSS